MNFVSGQSAHFRRRAPCYASPIMPDTLVNEHSQYRPHGFAKDELADRLRPARGDRTVGRVSSIQPLRSGNQFSFCVVPSCLLSKNGLGA